MKKLLLCLVVFVPFLATAQEETIEYKERFEQLGTMLPSPNVYRTASGAPGEKYWQQKADYQIKVKLNEAQNQITGSETITYYNQSPHPLNYLWLQLDQNLRKDGSDMETTSTYSFFNDTIPAKFIEQYVDNGGDAYNFDGGFKIDYVKDASGNPMNYLINKTMMKIRLKETLNPGDEISFSLAWSYNINDRMKGGGRSGFEYFEEDGNSLYTIAQFYPRMAVYNDVEGWQNKQFLGAGEFALTFGDFDVEISVPDDFIVGATGMVQNAKEVLTKDQYNRYQKALESTEQTFIVTEEEAIENEKEKSTKYETWKFSTENVRDFGFAASRKFIWDGMMVELESSKPFAQSFYPKEGNPLWEEESTKAVKNTLVLYSERTFDYPYPQATSVHAASIGMEYPMICFNFGRPNPDGTYSTRTQLGMTYVIVHEVGHNFFPMIVNSDERQWAWMDEGLNSFLESNVMWEYYPDLPYTDNSPQAITGYMKSSKDKQRPIMTNPEQVLRLGPNAYTKPAAALNLLRNTILGPELFDESFKAYAQRWKFKHPTPADFFRTMEDASAVDLDWFWRGWFYTTDHVDVAVDEVKYFRIATKAEDMEKKTKAPKGDLGGKKEGEEEKKTDFSDGPEYLTVQETPSFWYGEYRSKMDDKAIEEYYKDKHFYEVTFKNEGGLVSPLLMKFNYTDGTSETKMIPAEIWRKNEGKTRKVFILDKEVESLVFDPENELADTETSNNIFPKAEPETKVDKFKEGK
jgi:hypothetical protein